MLGKQFKAWKCWEKLSESIGKGKWGVWRGSSFF